MAIDAVDPEIGAPKMASNVRDLSPQWKKRSTVRFLVEKSANDYNPRQSKLIEDATSKMRTRSTRQEREPYNERLRQLGYLEKSASKIQAIYRQQFLASDKITDDVFSLDKGTENQHKDGAVDEQGGIDEYRWYYHLTTFVVFLAMTLPRMIERYCCRKREAHTECGEEQIPDVTVDGEAPNDQPESNKSTSQAKGQMQSTSVPTAPGPGVESATANTVSAHSGAAVSGVPVAPGAPFPGMETFVAQTMAAQAASTASSGAAAGVSTSVAEATVVNTTSTVLATVGVAATSSQVATIAAVTTVVASSAAAASSMLSSTTVPIATSPLGYLSTCGIQTPDFRKGKFTMSFQGFDRAFDERESQLLENTIAETYNLVTRGPNQATQGCIDQYLREMQNSTLVDQAFFRGENNESSTLDLTFDGWVICDGCPRNEPLFGSGSGFDLSFIFDHLKAVVTEVVDMTNTGELPASFVPSKAIAKTTPRTPSNESAALEEDLLPQSTAVEETVLLNIPIGIEANVESSGKQPIFPHPSYCGSKDPDFFSGIWKFSLHDVAQSISESDAATLGSLLVDTYNNVTIGNVIGPQCQDVYQREMSRATLVDQVPSAGTSPLKLTFKTWSICNGCSEAFPLFGKGVPPVDVNTTRRVEEVTFDLAMMEETLRAAVTRLVGFTNRGKLPTGLIPSKVSILAPELNGSESSPALLNLPMAVEESNSNDGQKQIILPEPSVCGSTDPDFYSGIWTLSLQGSGVRMFSAEEATAMEQLLLQTYNEVSVGASEIGLCHDAYQREMSRATILDQVVSENAGGSIPTLVVSFKTWLICNGCSESAPLFGSAGRMTNSTRRMQEGSFDLNKMSDTLRKVIDGMVVLINSEKIEGDMLPSKLSILPPAESQSSMESVGNNNKQALLNIPIAASYGEGDFDVIVPDPSECGLSDPSFFQGTVRMSFEGFSRDFSESEAKLMASTVASSYNELSRGNLNRLENCADIYQREMSNVRLVDQDRKQVLGTTVLDLTFETWIICDGCPFDPENVVFGTNTISRSVNTNDFTFLERHMEGMVSGMVELVNDNKLPLDFVPDRVYVKGASDDGSILIHVPILVYHDETNGHSVEFPGPSEAPTASMVPSDMPSSEPSLSVMPSEVPSMVPSFVPSEIPSVLPSFVPSETPSFVPSESPSKVPSFVPSMIPSVVPSNSPSMVPSYIPSESPSMVPSYIPSEAPSMIPSESPSSLPSMIPSSVPSESPTPQPTPAPTLGPCSGLNLSNQAGTYIDDQNGHKLTIGTSWTYSNGSGTSAVGTYTSSDGLYLSSDYSGGDSCPGGVIRSGTIEIYFTSASSSTSCSEPSSCVYKCVLNVSTSSCTIAVS